LRARPLRVDAPDGLAAGAILTHKQSLRVRRAARAPKSADRLLPIAVIGRIMKVGAGSACLPSDFPESDAPPHIRLACASSVQRAVPPNIKLSKEAKGAHFAVSRLRPRALADLLAQTPFKNA
jgi:hypothetical protein